MIVWNHKWKSSYICLLMYIKWCPSLTILICKEVNPFETKYWQKFTLQLSCKYTVFCNFLLLLTAYMPVVSLRRFVQFFSPTFISRRTDCWLHLCRHIFYRYGCRWLNGWSAASSTSASLISIWLPKQFSKMIYINTYIKI